MYYYTDYNTFKLILTNGTLRFKESTSSNDRLDTIQLYNELITMAEDKLRDANLKAEQKFYFFGFALTQDITFRLNRYKC